MSELSPTTAPSLVLAQHAGLGDVRLEPLVRRVVQPPPRCSTELTVHEVTKFSYLFRCLSSFSSACDWKPE